MCNETEHIIVSQQCFFLLFHTSFDFVFPDITSDPNITLSGNKSDLQYSHATFQHVDHMELSSSDFSDNKYPRHFPFSGNATT